MKSFHCLATIALAAAATLTVASQASAEPILEIRCASDSLSPDQARARLEWARACGVPHRVDTFDTAIPSGNNAGTLIEYIETFNFDGANAYSGVSNGNQINDTFVRNQFYNGLTNQLTVNGLKKWTRTNFLPRPAYPTFGSHVNPNFGTALYPHPTLADCRLYTDKLGASPINTATTSFYVNAYCVSSCYTPEQEVLFSDGYAPIREALDEVKPEMITLSPRSTLGSVKLTQNKVYSYTRDIRDARQVIYEIQTASGGELRVTDKHPIIDGSGRVVEARSLKVGDKLVRDNGKQDEIVSFVKKSYFGKVYNIRPATTDRVSNIIVAQGFLVGSSRYQNDDADYMNRVILSRGIPKNVLP